MREDIRVIYNDTPSPLYPSAISVSYCDGTYRIQRHQSEHTVVEYVLDGEGYIYMNNEWHRVGKDSVYILKSGIQHDYYSSSEKPWKKIFINFKGTLPLILLKEYGLADTWLYDGEELKPLFERIAALIPSEKSNVYCQESVCTTFIELLMALHRTKIRSAHSKEAIKMKDFLDSSPCFISNSELAAHIFHSTDYCIKLFKKEYGVTPYDYQITQRIALACQMLRQTNMTVSEVAASVGYSDTHYFSRLFKQKQGVCPKIYKKQNSN